MSGEGRFAENELLCVLASGISREKRIHGAGMVGSRLALAYSLVLKSRKRGKHIYGRGDSPCGKIRGKELSALGDISRKVGNG